MSTITLCLFYLTMADRSPSAEYFLTFYSIIKILVCYNYVPKSNSFIETFLKKKKILRSCLNGNNKFYVWRYLDHEINSGNIAVLRNRNSNIRFDDY